MPVYLLPEDVPYFPHPGLADKEDGLLAIGGNLNADTLLLAYHFGIFPWFNPGELVHWYSPDPRSVIYPSELHVSRSMRTYFNNDKFSWSIDRRFDEVIERCSSTGNRSVIGTWISDEMKSAYCELNRAGYARSIEVWEGDTLVGGLYGIWLGKVFFGESMFSSKSNASKFGLISFVRHFSQRDQLKLIDCQIENPHLNRLGARTISASKFLEHIKEWSWLSQQPTD